MALCLPTFSHFLIVNETSLSLSLSLHRSLSLCLSLSLFLSLSLRERQTERKREEKERKTCVCVPPQAGKSARLLLLVRWLSATNKPTNMQECTAAFLSFLYQHSIGLAWCQYILVPCPYSPPPPCVRFLVARSIRPSPLLLSSPSPHSCHPYPLYQDTCITGI